MKKCIVLSLVCAGVLAGGLFGPFSSSADVAIFQTHEYVTVRWGGRDNTHVIRANGRVEMLGLILKRVSRPDRVDERSFYMNIAMNAMAREGYEVVAMTNDEIVMKRATVRQDLKQ